MNEPGEVRIHQHALTFSISDDAMMADDSGIARFMDEQMRAAQRRVLHGDSDEEIARDEAYLRSWQGRGRVRVAAMMQCVVRTIEGWRCRVEPPQPHRGLARELFDE